MLKKKKKRKSERFKCTDVMFFSNVRLKEGLCHDVQATDIITWKITF